MRNKSEKIISAITRIMIRIIKTIRSDQNEHKKWSSQLWRPKRLVEPWSALEWWWTVWYKGIFSGNHRHCHRHRHPSHHRHHHHHYLCHCHHFHRHIISKNGKYWFLIWGCMYSSHDVKELLVHCIFYFSFFYISNVFLHKSLLPFSQSFSKFLLFLVEQFSSRAEGGECEGGRGWSLQVSLLIWSFDC